MNLKKLAGLLLLGSMLLAAPAVSAASEPSAVAAAKTMMDAMGGVDAWNDTRFVSFHFFGGRKHWIDRETRDLRLEFEDREGTKYLVLMNVDTKAGRVWINGEPADAEAQSAALENVHQAWINDSYWMFMPYKLRDPGTNLKHAGEKAMEDGRAADVLELTFGDGIGYTPQNKYEIWVGKDSGLVEAWTFYAAADDAEPRFTMPWTGWKKFGGIMLATDHGRGLDWDIAVHDSLDRSVFESTAPVGGSAP